MTRSAVAAEPLTLHLDTLTYGGEALSRHAGQAIFLFPRPYHLKTIALLLRLNRAIL